MKANVRRGSRRWQDNRGGPFLSFVAQASGTFMDPVSGLVLVHGTVDLNRSNTKNLAGLRTPSLSVVQPSTPRCTKPVSKKGLTTTKPAVT